MFDRRAFEIATKDRITTGHLRRRGRRHRRADRADLRPGPHRPRRHCPPQRSAPTSARRTGSPARTSFANPAVTIGRIFSDTFAGIAPGSAPGFIAAQIVGGLLGLALIAALYPDAAATAERRRRPAPHRRPSRRSTDH